MTSHDASSGVVIGFALLLIASMAGASVGFVGAAGAQSQSKADVVFVFDRTGSMDDVAADLKTEVSNVANSLDSKGIDAQYGLVTYEVAGTENIRQPLTSDPTKLEDSLGFTTSGGTEDASDAIIYALDEFQYRSDAQTVIIVLSDEDDDSTDTTRQQAINRLNDEDAALVAVSEPSGDFGYSEAETLRNMAEEQANDGRWSDIDAADFIQVIEDIIGAIEEATGGTADTEPDPTLTEVDVSADTESTAEAGGADVSSEGGELTTYFDSNENPVALEIVVEGPNETTTTLTREDVDGDRFEGYRVTESIDEPGNYTVTIRDARTASNADLLEETGVITRNVTVGGDNATDAANETDAANATDAESDSDRQRPACTTMEVPDEVTVDGENVSTVPPTNATDAELLEATRAEVDGEERRVRLVDTTGDGEADLAVVDLDGDGDSDPTCGQFHTVYPSLDWENWQSIVT